MLPSKQESYELIEDCTQLSKEIIDLLDAVIPYLVEDGRKEELATLMRLSFADIRATIDGVTSGCNYLKRHDEKNFCNNCSGVNAPLLAEMCLGVNASTHKSHGRGEQQ